MGLTASAALAYLMFNLYTPPCFAALGAMSAEMKSKKWFWGGIALQLGTGFTVGFIVYQIGTLITTGYVGKGFLGGLIAVAVFVVTIVGIVIKNNRKIEKNDELEMKFEMDEFDVQDDDFVEFDSVG